MNRIMVTAVLGAAATLATAALATAALANDNYSSSSSAQPSAKELMQQCMTQQKAQNSTASEADMKKTCHDQVKTQIAQMKAQESNPSTPPRDQSSMPSRTPSEPTPR
jgi:hypothetical protein